MNNIHYDLIKDALMRMVYDRYNAPGNMKDLREKIRLIEETYDLVEAEQKKLTDKS